MSTRSKIAFAALDAGHRIEENLAEWQGSPEQCWEAYVESKSTDTRPRYGYDVYWFEMTCGSRTYWKIGVSHSAEKRLAHFAKTFPVASWKILRVCHVRNLAEALVCEADMLVACRSLHIEGEWIRTGEDE